MIRNTEITNYINERQHLFWYSPAPKDITVSDELLVETILNYGSMEDVKELFLIMGIKNVSNIFYNSINKSERRKANYHELTINYFTLLFNRYANCREL